jgi:hypothetical protein
MMLIFMHCPYLEVAISQESLTTVKYGKDFKHFNLLSLHLALGVLQRFFASAKVKVLNAV